MNMDIAPLHQNAASRTRITVMQGLVEVASDPAVVLTTVLGGCVAVCLFDPVARVGGMNHFHLAQAHGVDEQVGADSHYGVYMMEKLIDAMLHQGARKSRLRAHVYGGANLHQVGAASARFAERFLDMEGILISHRDLGGDAARRIDFLPAAGMARCRHVDPAAAPVPRVAPFRVCTNLI